MNILAMASSPLSDRPIPHDNMITWVPKDLMALLQKRNGFYAFVSALHLYPLSGAPVSTHGITEEFPWRETYGATGEDISVFGQDVFGCQFCASSEGTYFRLDLETGEREVLGNTLEEFFQSILDDPEVQTGYPLALEWQEKNGPLQPNGRLGAKTPFFMGGEYAVENLFELDTLKRIRLGLDLFHQTKNLPDGQKILLEIAP